jgi:hypothetical protein
LNNDTAKKSAISIEQLNNDNIQNQLFMLCSWTITTAKFNKGNTKRGVSPRLKIRSCDLDLWPWKSIGFQILLRSKYVPSLGNIHWRMLILECSQGCYAVKIWPSDIDFWPMTLKINRTTHVPSLVKIHWRILILECSQGCYVVKIWPGDLDLWPWKSIGFQTLVRPKYVPSLVKIHWRMLILECSQGCYVVKIWPLDLWPWKSIGFQTPLRAMYVPSLVKINWRMLILECSQGYYAVNIWPGDIDLWSGKSIGFQILLRTKYVPSLVNIHWRMLILECSQGCDGQMDGSVTISLRNFIGEGITISVEQLNNDNSQNQLFL